MICTKLLRSHKMAETYVVNMQKFLLLYLFCVREWWRCSLLVGGEFCRLLWSMFSGEDGAGKCSFAELQHWYHWRYWRLTRGRRKCKEGSWKVCIKNWLNDVVTVKESLSFSYVGRFIFELFGTERRSVKYLLRLFLIIVWLDFCQICEKLGIIDFVLDSRESVVSYKSWTVLKSKTFSKNALYCFLVSASQQENTDF